ncbi:MAG: VWA domain-containing protein [Candidatus Heimdallarchaeota archaeon]
MLRYFGLPISPDETISAQKVYQLLGVASRDDLLLGLRATLVKQKENLSIFNECFNMYFSPARYLLSEVKDSKVEKRLKPEFRRFLSRLESSPQRIDYIIGEMLVQNKVSEAVQTTISMIASNGVGSSSDLRKELERLQGTLGRAFQLAFGLRLPIRGLTPIQRQALPATTLRFAGTLQQFQQNLEREMAQEKENGGFVPQKPIELPEIMMPVEAFLDQDLTTLSLTITNVKHQLIVIGRILASRERRRRERAKRGKLDFRRTMRKNLATNGIPLNLIQKKKRIQDPEIFILNDVSRSTRWIADWFFVITYAARSVFKRIRVFEFDNCCVEVTDALNQPTIDQALEERELAWEHTLRPRRIHSDYQTSFEDFSQLIGYHPINRRTTVLIFGDCRDFEGMWTQGNPVSADLIRKMAILAKRCLILNPEPPEMWNSGDSVVRHFENAGAEVFSVASMRELIDFVYSIKP